MGDRKINSALEMPLGYSGRDSPECSRNKEIIFKNYVGLWYSRLASKLQKKWQLKSWKKAFPLNSL